MFSRIFILLCALLVVACQEFGDGVVVGETAVPVPTTKPTIQSTVVETAVSTNTVIPTMTETPQSTSIPFTPFPVATPSLTTTLVPELLNDTEGSIIFIASQYDSDSGLEYERLALINSPGEGYSILETPFEYIDSPVWSPDCSQIAFSASVIEEDGSTSTDIFTMDLDGSNLEQITMNPERDLRPAWSPDGEQIAFASNQQGAIQIFTHFISTGEVWQLTEEGSNFDPDWSPSGEQIIFTTSRESGTSFANSIFTIRADGSEPRGLLPFEWGPEVGTVDEPAYYNPSEPTWSPDVQWIAFTVMELINGLFDEVEKVYISAADGSEIRPLVAAERRENNQNSEDFYYVQEANPVWSPDGTKVLYTRWGIQWGEELIRPTTLCIADFVSGETTCMANEAYDEAWFSADWCRAE